MCGTPSSPVVPEGAVPKARTGERTTEEPGAVPKTGSLITFMSSLKSFAFPTQRWPGADRVRWSDGHVGGRQEGLGGPRALAPPRRASRRSTGSPPHACARGTPHRARPRGARRHRRAPPAAARRCCCGCERPGRRRRAGPGAGTPRRTTRRRRRRRPRRARRAGRRRPGWRSSAARPARPSRRGARARRSARALGLQQAERVRAPPGFPGPAFPSPRGSAGDQRPEERVAWGPTEPRACLGNARGCL